jgi:hypothetical protein
MFPSSTDRNKHIDSVHLGIKPFKCEYEGCGAIAKDTNLAKHIRTVHENIKDFVCTWDGKMFHG